jgi:hypothetical protein
MKKGVRTGQICVRVCTSNLQTARVICMNFSLLELKESLYVIETLFGVFLLVLAYSTLRMAFNTCDCLYYLIPGLALLVVSGACIMFGIEAFILRDDPEIWD